MIGFLRGKVHHFEIDYLLLDVNNVGYRINFYRSQLLKKDEEILIYTYENVREDESTLYGFLTLEEYDIFVKLISVKGLGPKLASGILASAPVEDIIEAIRKEDIGFMRNMPGIGAKTAGQIILDLRGKFVPQLDILMENKVLMDVEEALKQLGYKTGEIRPVLKQLASEDGLNADEYLKKALSLLVK